MFKSSRSFSAVKAFPSRPVCGPCLQKADLAGAAFGDCEPGRALGSVVADKLNRASRGAEVAEIDVAAGRQRRCENSLEWAASITAMKQCPFAMAGPPSIFRVWNAEGQLL